MDAPTFSILHESPESPATHLYTENDIIEAAQEFFKNHSLKDQILDMLRNGLKNYTHQYQIATEIEKFVKDNNDNFKPFKVKLDYSIQA